MKKGNRFSIKKPPQQKPLINLLKQVAVKIQPMSIQIEIWKIFENDTLATYAFGDMELFSTRAKGKVAILKKTGDIFLVEKIDKTTTEKELDTIYLPRVKESLRFHRKKNFYPHKTDTSAILKLTKKPKIPSIHSDNPKKWSNARITDVIKNKLNKVLVSFFRSTADGFTELTGTGFIVLAYGRHALVMTASHQFAFIDTDRSRSPKYLNGPDAPPKIQIHAGEILTADATDFRIIRAVYKSDDFTDACKINGVSIVPELDIALCAIEFQKEYKGPDFTVQLGLDSRPPRKGDEVLAVGFSGGKSDKKAKNQDKTEQNISVTRKFEVRRGTVTGVFTAGAGEMTRPFFETTIPIDAGMEGGPVMPFNITNPGLNGCAVILKDISRKEAFKNFLVPGHSIMAMVWPALLLPFAEDLIKKLGPSENTLLSLIRKKIIKDLGSAHKHTIVDKKDHHLLAVSRTDFK